MIFRTFAEAYVDFAGHRTEAEVSPALLRTIHEVAERSARLKKQGYRIRPWHAGARTPACVRRNNGYGSYWEFDYDLTRGWLDHHYKLLDPNGSSIFVSEPYGLFGDSLARLARLAQSGWNVSIDSGRALWVPGGTVAVWIRKAGAA